MVNEEQELRQQQQTKRSIMASNTSKPLEAPPLAPTLLPVEIIFDILTRLPVESLLRFRSVCKLWCLVISDPHFIKSHLTFSTTNNLYIHHRLIFSTGNTIISIKSCPLYDVLYNGGSVNDDALELDYPLKDPRNSVISGSCNGLFLIVKVNVDEDEGEDNLLFICNPSTRRANKVPNCGSRGRTSWYKFGYDESTDDFKVVEISCVLRDLSVMHDTIVKIYSLKTGIWKKIDYDFPFRNEFPINFSVKYLNGALYWTAGQNSNSWKILSFDLVKETYAEILQPVYDEGHTALTLGVFGEWLCVLCDYGRIRADVWVMKLKDSWTKLVSIPYHLIDPGFNQFSVPLCISNDGKVLLQLGSRLVVYDSKICSFSVVQNFNACDQPYTFVESLVSPTCPRDNNRVDIKENLGFSKRVFRVINTVIALIRLHTPMEE